MPEEIELERGPSIAERLIGGWRVIASAWLVAAVFLVLFAGVQALASRHAASPRQQSLVGATIPRHDPSCDTAAGTPSAQNCELTLGDFERETAPYYGW